MSHDRSACTGSFSSGVPCPAAGQGDRYLRGLAATSPRQIWSQFEADESGDRCEQFRLAEARPVAKAFAELREVAGGCLEGKHFDESREWAEDAPMLP
jgi:hypothetical protein